MADYTIASDQVGVYEIPLTAGNVTTVTVANRYGSLVNRVQVSVHDASMPVYARISRTVSVKDPNSSVVLAGTWLELQTGLDQEELSTVALISAADATVSVARA
jgi:hypothetical protein